LRIYEAIALRVMDLDAQLPAVRVRRAIVDGQLTIPKSRYGLRTAGISTSGMNMPPNGPKWPVSSGAEYGAAAPSWCVLMIRYRLQHVVFL
jgi:hypothetical protein